MRLYAAPLATGCSTLECSVSLYEDLCGDLSVKISMGSSVAFPMEILHASAESS